MPTISMLREIKIGVQFLRNAISNTLGKSKMRFGELISICFLFQFTGKMIWSL